MKDLYIVINDEQAGPFTLADLQTMVDAGEISTETLYAKPGVSSWERLSTILPVAAAREARAEDGVQRAQVQPEGEISRCERLSESLQTLSTYAGAREWTKKVAEEVNALPATLRCFDQIIAAELVNLDEEKRRFEQQSLLKRTFSSHGPEEAVAGRISVHRQQRAHLVKLVEGMQQKAVLVPSSTTTRDLLLKEIRHHMKELRAKKKEATAAMTAIRREARVASDGAGKTWIGLYDSSLAADQRRGIRHAKEETLRPYEDAKETIERQMMALEKHLIWLEQFE
jgi:hypothetical protein